MNIPVANCSSCGACANICAHGAITMQLDKEGFYRPVVDSSKCVKCGLCEKVCPWENEVFNPNGSSKSPKTVAAYALNDEIRLQSSSGGIFTVLAEKVLDDGGVVVGVAQLSPTKFGHIIVDDKDDLANLRGSKYVQADVGTIYKDIRALLKNGRKVLFSGTPCQVAGLYAVLGRKTFENLYTIDIVCHGTPSVKVYQKFIESLSVAQKSLLQFTAFRDKSTGWKSYSVTHFFCNGEKKTIPYNKSNYMRMFLSRICQNKSCVNCLYRKLPRIADITLGDYWGVAKHHPEMDDDKGTSVVLINTKRGERLYLSIGNNIKQCESSLENAIAGNPCIVRSSKEHFRRPSFFADLDRMPMEKLVDKYCTNLPLYKVLLLKIYGYFKRSFFR